MKNKYFQEQKYYIYQGYYRRTTHPHIFLSHDIWNFNNPKDPVLKGEAIHHKNGDPSDDRIENLQKMTLSEHLSLHNGNGNQIKEKNHHWRGGIKTKSLHLCNETIKKRTSYSIFQHVNSLGEIKTSYFNVKGK